MDSVNSLDEDFWRSMSETALKAPRKLVVLLTHRGSLPEKVQFVAFSRF
jgi:hypothetical protein